MFIWGTLLALAAGFVTVVVIATHRRLTFTSAALAVGVTASAGAGVALAPTETLGYTVVRSVAAVAAFGLAAAHHGVIFQSLRREGWLLALVGWATVSLWWAPDLGSGVRALGGFASALLLGASLASVRREQAAKLVMWALAVVAAVSAVVALYLPSVGIIETARPGSTGLVDMAVGLFAWNSEYGMAAGAAAILAAWCSLREGRWRYRLTTVGMFAILLQADSATSILATVAGLLVLVGIHVRRFRMALVPAGVLAAVFAVLGFLSGPIHDLLDLLGRSSDLTGRTVIWNYVLDRVQARPFVGHGLGAEPDLQQAFGFVGHAHNGYIEMAFSLGGIGLLLFGFSFVRAAWRSRHDALWLGLLTAFAVSNLANNYLMASDLMVVVFGWVATSAHRHPGEQQRGRGGSVLARPHDADASVS